MKPFKVNERVGFLHEKGEATIVRIEGNRYWIVDEDGFDRCVHENELIKIHSSPSHPLEEHHLLEKKIRHDILNTDKPTKAASKKKKQDEFWEVDLHSHAILETEVNLSGADILRRQIEHFKYYLNKARKHRINRLIIIHGVGEGVLKKEIAQLLRKMDDLEFFDADPKEYGQGATEIKLYFNF